MMDKGYIYLCDTKGFTIVNKKNHFHVTIITNVSRFDN